MQLNKTIRALANQYLFIKKRVPRAPCLCSIYWLGFSVTHSPIEFMCCVNSSYVSNKFIDSAEYGFMLYNCSTNVSTERCGSQRLETCGKQLLQKPMSTVPVCQTKCCGSILLQPGICAIRCMLSAVFRMGSRPASPRKISCQSTYGLRRAATYLDICPDLWTGVRAFVGGSLEVKRESGHTSEICQENLDILLKYVSRIWTYF